MVSAVHDRHGLPDPARIVTAADDANCATLVERLHQQLLAAGADVINMGKVADPHEIAVAALQEDAQGIACISRRAECAELLSGLSRALPPNAGGRVSLIGCLCAQDYDQLAVYESSNGSDDEGFMHNGNLCAVDFARAILGRCSRAGNASLLSQQGWLRLARAITIAESEVHAGKDASAAIAFLGSHPKPTGRPIPVVGLTGAGSIRSMHALAVRCVTGCPALAVATVSITSSDTGHGCAVAGRLAEADHSTHRNVYLRSIVLRNGPCRDPHKLIMSVLDTCRAYGVDLIIASAQDGQAQQTVADAVDIVLDLPAGAVAYPGGDPATDGHGDISVASQSVVALHGSLLSAVRDRYFLNWESRVDLRE